MFAFKKTQLLLIISLLVLFSGCINNISKEGLTLNINPNELNMQANIFPIKKDFTLANIIVNKPSLGISENQITAIVGLDLKAFFIPDSTATLAIAGEPYFVKEKNALFLRNISINDISFENNQISQSFSSELISILDPLLNELFKNIPIYKIKEDSYKSTLVKDVKVINSELLVTFGL
ncbi:MULTISPECIES: DUF1439 domain-containing protein [Arcobacteraceae]|uniref:DUF1439 domain-containing protein n=1 Tax=Poseidonibacter parvus TaxID=1850254 RepID=A0A1P8KIX7_9BACT|nr:MULTISPECIES: DUF1439 domain-containing protein [Arcobacteraceae]APW64508.1 hypothetical protein LPB137_00965 [Poseidonibacter parvus]